MVTLLSLLALAWPFVVSPGASFTLTIGAAAEGDFWSPLKVWAGTSLGIVVIAGVAGATGVGTFVATNDTAGLLFGLVGGIILMAFGVAAAVKAFGSSAGTASAINGSRGSLVLWSFIVVISNVKALSLYAVVVPIATDTGLTGVSLYAAFAATHIVLLLVWLSLLGLGVRRLPLLAQSPLARRILVGGAGAMMFLLGIRSILDAVTS